MLRDHAMQQQNRIAMQRRQHQQQQHQAYEQQLNQLQDVSFSATTLITLSSPTWSPFALCLWSYVWCDHTIRSLALIDRPIETEVKKEMSPDTCVPRMTGFELICFSCAWVIYTVTAKHRIWPLFWSASIRLHWFSSYSTSHASHESRCRLHLALPSGTSFQDSFSLQHMLIGRKVLIKFSCTQYGRSQSDQASLAERIFGQDYGTPPAETGFDLRFGGLGENQVITFTFTHLTIALQHIKACMSDALLHAWAS